MKYIKITIIAALTIIPSILIAGASQSELNQLAKEWNDHTQRVGIPASASKVSLWNTDNGRTLVISFSGKMIDRGIKEGIRGIEQIKNSVFTGMTREDISNYKSQGYTRALVIAGGKSSYYYFR